MDAFLQQFQHLKIQLEEITSATNNFDDKNNFIGVGGFGKVYKGEVSHSKGRSMVAIKRLDPKYGQGIPEFLKEITTLSRYRHENLISLLGFCYQGNEMILVYEYASRGSLDHHLNSPHLTWSQRIKICLDAAKGLSYLHDPMETHQRLIHCDVKSANILLDDQWNGKVADFGLSIMGPANEQHSVIVTPAAGTGGYIDPLYWMTHTLTKESDVYSFGVVLLEVLCGRLCCIYSNSHVQQNILPMWLESYKQKNLNKFIFQNPNLQPLDHSALETFSDIAYRCLNESREGRPKMAEVMTELKTALNSQEFFESREFNEWKAQVSYYEEILKTAEPPLNYTNTSYVEFWKLLSKGVLINEGKTWFSLNKNGENCEMISFAECLVSVPHEFDGRSSAYNSRFVVGSYPYTNGSVETRVKPQFLSPGITYTMNLVFKFSSEEKVRRFGSEHIELTYKLQGDTETSISYLAYEREDGWWMCELYQFVSAERTVDLKILFTGFHGSFAIIQVEGIEFRPRPRPLEEVKHKDEKQPISDSDANWEEKLPTNYEKIMKWSTDSMQWTTKKEAFSILRKGFLINDGKVPFTGRRTRVVNYDKTTCIWFFLDENGKKCHLLSASIGFGWLNWADMLSLPESRFGSALQCSFQMLVITNRIFPLLSSETTYARYLVYKLPEDQSEFMAPVKVKDMRSNHSWYIYLVSPQTPVIRLNVDQNTHNPVNGPKMKGLPQQRNDGWMEVQIGVFQNIGTTGDISANLKLTTCGKILKGLIIEGVECRPI